MCFLKALTARPGDQRVGYRGQNAERQAAKATRILPGPMAIRDELAARGHSERFPVKAPPGLSSLPR